MNYDDPFGLIVTVLGDKALATVGDLWNNSATFRRIYNALSNAPKDKVNYIISETETGGSHTRMFPLGNVSGTELALPDFLDQRGRDNQLAHEIAHAAGQNADAVGKQTGVPAACGPDEEAAGSTSGSCVEAVRKQIMNEVEEAKRKKSQSKQ